MQNKRYKVQLEYQWNNGYGKTNKSKCGVGFKNKENAIKKFKDMTKNPQEYMCWGRNRKATSVKFITISIEEVKFQEV